MGWRYRKSVSILPGVRVNFGLHSSSISFGGKGFRTTYSSTGRVTRSFGIPGTGLSYVTTSNPGRQRIPHVRERDASLFPPLTTYAMPEYEGNPIATAERPMQESSIDVDMVLRSIRDIYRTSDVEINWKKILTSDSCDNPSEEWNYYKARAEAVFNGDLDTYLEIISDVNPFDDLLAYGSGFECGTNDPRVISVRFKVNSETVLPPPSRLSSEQYNELLQDYVCAVSIRVARDLFALLPLRHVIVDAENGGSYILSVDFERNEFQRIDFENADASNTVTEFAHRMSFDARTGFTTIETLDS